MIKVFIVDDEQRAIDGLKSLLELFVKDVEVVGESTSVEDASKQLKQIKVDLLFLDITLGSLTGFDLLLALGENQDFRTIFVTAHDQYALKAMRAKAIDYLLKPIDPDELIKAVDSFKQLHEAKVNSLSRTAEPLKLALPGLSESIIISSGDILYIEAQKNYSDVHLKNGEKHTVSRSLNVFENSLDRAGFLRIHRGYLINLQSVKSLSKSDGGGVNLINGKFIPMGKSRREYALSVLQAYFSFV